MTLRPLSRETAESSLGGPGRRRCLGVEELLGGADAVRELRGVDDGGILLDSDLGQDLQVPQLERDRVTGDDIRGLGQLPDAEGFALGGNDLAALSSPASGPSVTWLPPISR